MSRYIDSGTVAKRILHRKFRDTAMRGRKAPARLGRKIVDLKNPMEERLGLMQELLNMRRDFDEREKEKEGGAGGTSKTVARIDSEIDKCLLAFVGFLDDSKPAASASADGSASAILKLSEIPKKENFESLAKLLLTRARAAGQYDALQKIIGSEFCYVVGSVDRNCRQEIVAAAFCNRDKNTLGLLKKEGVVLEVFSTEGHDYQTAVDFMVKHNSYANAARVVELSINEEIKSRKSSQRLACLILKGMEIFLLRGGLTDFVGKDKEDWCEFVKERKIVFWTNLDEKKSLEDFMSAKKFNYRDKILTFASELNGLNREHDVAGASAVRVVDLQVHGNKGR